ncbi:MAG: hypothetical protein ACI4EE_10435 [Lachnospiraceae bacterium]
MGKGKVLKTTISLLGKIDPSLNRALSKAQKQSANTGKSMSKNMKNAGAAMTKTVKGFAKTAVAVFASISAAAKLKEYAQECVTAAKAQIEAETKLETVLKNVESIQIRGPNAAAEAANNLKKVASDIQKTGVIGDEVLLSGMQQLATFQLDDKAISTLSTGMADLLAQQKGLNASQTDAVSVANMIGKVMSGSTSALSRIGITFTDKQEKLLKSGDAMKRAATLAEVLQQNVGGVNKALAQTDQGKLQQAENTIGDLKEQIGMKLLPIIANIATKAVPLVEKAFDKVGQVVDKISPHITKLVSKSMPLISKAFNSIGPVIDQIAPIAQEMFSFMIESARQLEPVFMALGQSVMDGFGGQLPGIISVLQSLFGYIQQISPTIITIVSVIGTALGPIVSSLISVAQLLLPKIMTLIQSLGPLFQALSPVLNLVGSLFGTVFSAAGKFIGDVIDNITGIITCLTGVIDYLNYFFAGGWVNVWEGIKSTFTNVWNSIKSVARFALSAIVKPINNIISGINKITSVVGIKAIPTIEIPQFAEGATVSRPTLAVVGEGSDPETIVPHNNKPRSRRLLANAAAGVGMSIGKGNSYTYAPVIYANNVQGVKEALADDFERFKEYMRQMLGDDDREVFA